MIFQEIASALPPPGRAPVNEDVVEYFLFENHKGYCVHFASAATLMYRALGFPARYASGYAVQPSDFVRQEDGVWRAQVTDESAHAWTEIFLEDYGWTPVEVTPASDGNYSTSYPGVDTEALEEIISVMNLDTYVPDAAEDAENAVTAPEGEENSGGSKISDGFTPGRYHDLILIAATVSTESLLLIPLFLPIMVGKDGGMRYGHAQLALLHAVAVPSIVEHHQSARGTANGYIAQAGILLAHALALQRPEGNFGMNLVILSGHREAELDHSMGLMKIQLDLHLQLVRPVVQDVIGPQ